jgi:hypothetical protein
MHIGLSRFQHSLLVAAQASARAEATAANAEASRLRKRLALTTSELQKMSERVLLGHVVMVCASVRAPVLNWSRRRFRSCHIHGNPLPVSEEVTKLEDELAAAKKRLAESMR